MNLSTKTMPVLATMLLALGLAGCQGTRLPYLGTRASAPAPLPPAPTGRVAVSELPPPGGASAGSQFPDSPAGGEPAIEMEVAAASAPEISKNSVVGSWKADAAGVNCQMFLTLTKYGQNSRGGTRGCSGELTGMRGWNVDGKQLQIFDENGSRIAVLYSTGSERFDGQTTDGRPVSLSR